MAKEIKYKVNKDGFSVTYCPNGFTTYSGNRRKRVGDDCVGCQYRKHVDFDKHIVECQYGGKRKKD